MRKYILALILAFYSFSALAATENNNASAEVAKAAQIWQQAIASHNVKKIAALYAPHAYLYATFENQINTPEGILQYFQKLAANKNLQVKFDTQHIRTYGDVAIDSGLYTFSYNQDGKQIHVPARYTFVYLHQGNAWQIIEHHSSVLPKPLQGDLP
jgi:uncharacterized protein (TIGR02246 family)